MKRNLLCRRCFSSCCCVKHSFEAWKAVDDDEHYWRRRRRDARKSLRLFFDLSLHNKQKSSRIILEIIIIRSLISSLLSWVWESGEKKSLLRSSLKVSGRKYINHHLKQLKILSEHKRDDWRLVSQWKKIILMMYTHLSSQRMRKHRESTKIFN